MCQENLWKLQILRSARIPFARARQLQASIAAPNARQWKRHRTSIVLANTPAARAKLRKWNWLCDKGMTHAIQVA
jgi:hypothetical protein